MRYYLAQEQNIILENVRALEIRRVKGLDPMPAAIHIIAGLKVLIIRLKPMLASAGKRPDEMLLSLDRTTIENLYRLIDEMNAFIERTFGKEVIL
jgi:hypothetical protein